MMPHKYDWYIEGQVVYLELWGEQTIDELHESNEIMIGFLESLPEHRHFIHVIVNDAKLQSVPVNVAQLGRILTYTKHPHLGWAVMTGEKQKNITDFIVTMLAKITRARYIRFTTLDEVVEHLKQVDTTLDWDNVNPTVTQMHLSN